jgi:predicted  nucleic acid-binding Zn-ribbon protein
VSPELQRLIRLQDIDVRIFELTDRLAAIPGQRQQLEEQFRQQTADYLGIEDALAAARAEHSRTEVDLADVEKTHEKFKSDLMRVRNQKEYGTILREIDATKKTISALETEDLQLMEKIEGYERELTERAPEFARRRGEVDAILAGFDGEVASVDAEIAELRAARERLAREVAPNFLAAYNRVALMRKGRAMSEVRREPRGVGKCSACNLVLRPQAFSDVRRGETLIVCDSCSRILFYRPEQEAPVEANVS